LGGRLSILLAIEGDKSKPFAGVVDIGHHAELLKLGLNSHCYGMAELRSLVGKQDIQYPVKG